MDSAGTGALIGIGVMVLFGVCLKLYDVQNKKNNSTKTPLLVRPAIKIVRQHSKMNMILPK